MSTSSSQGNQPLQPSPTTSLSKEQQKSANDGKRSLSQLERTTKVGRTSPSVGSISDALQRISLTNIDIEDPSMMSTSLPLENTSPLPADSKRVSTAKKDLMHKLKKQRMTDYKQSVYIPPMAKLSLQASDDMLFLLMDEVMNFLTGDRQVMLILGDSGAGKSTFNRHLENVLWQNYNDGDRIPLFVNLPALDRPNKALVTEQLKTLGFSKDQIRELKEHRQFLLICDGYDESQLTSNLYTTNLLNQPGQWDVKLLITCRTQYLRVDYRDQFVPMAAGQYYQSANNLFQEAVIVPFSRAQIKMYVDKYVQMEPRTWVMQDYMDKLTTIPNLVDLVKNPFLLTLALEALPQAVEGRPDLASLRVTRVELYDTFVNHWLDVNKRRLQNHKLRENYQRAFEELKDDGFVQSGIDFQKNLAASIFTYQGGKPIIHYISKNDGASWKSAFFGAEPRTTILREISILSRVGNQCRFVHRSVLEYFFSCTIWDVTKTTDESDPQRSSTDDTIAPSIGDSPLFQKNLVKEPSIIHFLAERVQVYDKFKQYLLAIIELSKLNAQASQAAANAITILVKAGIRFNGADLRGIRIPGADLAGGQFDSVLFQDADLTDVNLTNAWIRQVAFSRARLGGVKFSELPYLKMSGSVGPLAFSPDGKILAVGLRQGNIDIFDTGTWARIDTFHGHQDYVSSLAYSPTGRQLLSGSGDQTVRLWNCETRMCERIMLGHTDAVNAVTFSPCGRQIVSAGCDDSVRLWDAQTGAAGFVLLDEPDEIYCVSYSPDGHRIVAGDSRGTIWTIDTRTELHALVQDSNHGGVHCIAFSPDGQRFVAGHANGELQLWDSITGCLISDWKAHTAGVYDVNFSPKGQWIVSSGDNCAKLWNAAEGTLVSVLIGHTGLVRSVMFSPDGSMIASGSWDGTVRLRLWKMSSFGVEADSYSSSDRKPSVAYSPNGQIIVSSSWNDGVRHYDAVTGEPGLVISNGSSHAGCIAYSPDGLRVAVAQNKTDVAVLNATTGMIDFVLRGHMQDVNVLVFSPSGRWIATGSDDGTIRLWDASSGTSELVLDGFEDEVTSLAFSPCSHQIVSTFNGGLVVAWETESGRYRVFPQGRHEVLAVTYSPLGQQIALCADRYVKLRDEQTGGRQHRLKHDGFVQYAAYSSCGRWIAVGCNNAVWIWSCTLDQTWKCRKILPCFFSTIKDIAWRPGMREFVTGCRDGSIHVWKLENESSELSVRMVWSTGRPGFVATDAVIADTIGLSPINREFLRQRGANDESPPSPSLSSSDSDEEFAEDLGPWLSPVAWDFQ